MQRATLRAVGGSVMVAIPKRVLESLGLSANAKVDLTVEGDRLIVAPLAKPAYTLAELLALCEPDAPLSADEQAWQDMEPLGRETW